jgi:hypothetical protein
MRVNLRARDQDRAGSLVVREKSVPQGPDESSPVRSAGLEFLKSIRPGRDDRRMLAIAEPRAKPKSSVSIVPRGTAVSFCFISQHFVLGYFQ